MRFYIALLSFLFVACSKGKIPSTSEQGDAIGFSLGDSWNLTQSKGVIVDEFKDGDAMGVFAYFLEDGTWDGDETPELMYNQQVSRSSSVWSYSPLKYWSNNTAHKVKFLSYFPYNAPGVILSTNTTAGFPSVSFVPQSEVAQQIDFSTSSISDLKDKTSGEVVFNFDHQLTQVLFAAKVNGPKENVAVQIDKITFKGAKHCSGSYTSTSFEWDLSTAVAGSENTLYQIEGTEELEQNLSLSSTTYTSLVTNAGTMMLIPQEFSADQVSIEIYYTVTIIDGGTSDQYRQEIKAPAHKFEKGTKAIYQFTIDLTDTYYIRLDGVTDELWNDKEIDIEIDDMYFNLTDNIRAYTWEDHTTSTERLTIGIPYQSNLPHESIEVDKVEPLTTGDLTIDKDKSIIYYTIDNIQSTFDQRIKITLAFGDVTRILYIDISKKDILIEFTVTVEPWDDQILESEELLIKFSVEIEPWENATGDNILDGIIDIE